MNKSYFCLFFLFLLSGFLHGQRIDDIYEKAKNGDASAQYLLGFMYEYGKGRLPDYEKAFYWYQKSAKQGNMKAQCAIGRMYEQGKGVQQNKTEAIYWYQKSAAQKYEEAQKALARMENEVTPEYLEELPNSHLPIDTNYNPQTPEQQYELGKKYDEGKDGYPMDKQLAFFWYKKSAEQGYAKAEYNLGLMYDKGDAVLKNKSEALYWYKKSAEQKHAKAQYNLALMYYRGDGTLQDMREAFKWFKESAEQGYPPAQYNLGIMYYYGQGTIQNRDQARYWIRLSYENGYKKAKEAWDQLELWE